VKAYKARMEDGVIAVLVSDLGMVESVHMHQDGYKTDPSRNHEDFGLNGVSWEQFGTGLERERGLVWTEVDPHDPEVED
jgi:hypothetical protein